jgi:ribosomal protein L9
MRGIYAGEVHNVAAGYARNYLIPQKMAVYATPRNFERCGLIDPEIAAKEDAAAQKFSQEGDEEENADLKAADVLRKYLRNKTVKLIRNVDLNVPTLCHPGHVSAKNIRDKLSKQLKIDLEEHETIHIRNEPVVGLEEMDEKERMQLIMNMDGVMMGATAAVVDDDDDGKKGEDDEEESSVEEESAPAADATVEAAAVDDNSSTDEAKDCDTKVKQLGDYLAKITLAGGYIVPLHFRIERR